MNLQDAVQDAVAEGLVTVIGEEINEIVVREARRILRDHEEEFTRVVKTAVASAFAEMFKGAASPSAG